MQAISEVQNSVKLWGFTTPEAWPKSFETARHEVPVCSLNYTPALTHVQEKTLL